MAGQKHAAMTLTCPEHPEAKFSGNYAKGSLRNHLQNRNYHKESRPQIHKLWKQAIIIAGGTVGRRSAKSGGRHMAAKKKHLIDKMKEVAATPVFPAKKTKKTKTINLLEPTMRNIEDRNKIAEVPGFNVVDEVTVLIGRIEERRAFVAGKIAELKKYEDEDKELLAMLESQRHVLSTTDVPKKVS